MQTCSWWTGQPEHMFVHVDDRFLLWTFTLDVKVFCKLTSKNYAWLVLQPAGDAIVATRFNKNLFLEPQKYSECPWSTWRAPRRRRIALPSRRRGSGWVTSAGRRWTGGPLCPCCRGWWPRSAGRVRRETAAPRYFPGRSSWSSTLLSCAASRPTATTPPSLSSSTRRSSSPGSSTTAMIWPTLLISWKDNRTTLSLRCPVTSSRPPTQTRCAEFIARKL